MVSHARIHRGPGNLEARIEKERMITAGQDIHNHVGWVAGGGGGGGGGRERSARG